MDNYVHPTDAQDVHFCPINERRIAVFCIVNRDEQTGFLIGKGLGMKNFRERCGITISELNRLSGVSRTTIYAYERGQQIKRETEIEILEAIKRHKKAVEMRAEIRAALHRFGVDASGSRDINAIVDELRSIRHELMQFSSPEGDYDPDFSVLTNKEISDLEGAARGVIMEIKVIKAAH